MNSINQNQPEHNRENLRGNAAIERIQQVVKQAPTCFFCTSMATGESAGARPMNVRKADDQGILWFLSASDSHTNQELAMDGAVRLFFQGSQHTDFLHLHGNATVSTDRVKIEELWEPILSTWFTGGIDDPRITVIRVEPTHGYYWATKNGATIAFLKIMLGAMLGQTLDDSIEGKLNV